MNLSPFNQSGLMFRVLGPQNAQATAPKKRREPIEETVWRCPECKSTYEDEDEAAECCASTVATVSEPNNCPVCSKKWSSPWDASNCCLWKDIDAITRWEVASKVDLGMDWAEAINEIPNDQAKGCVAATEEK